MNTRGLTPVYSRAAAAQHALVADAAGDAVGVERLEQRLGVLARDAEPVAQLGQRHAAGGAGQLDRRGPRLLERLGREGQVASGPHRPALLDERRERGRILRPQRRRLQRARGQPGVQRLDRGGRAPPASAPAGGGSARARRRDAPAGRGGIGHGRPRDGDLGARQAHDQAVAGGGRHLPAQPQLHVGLPARAAPRSPRAGRRVAGASAVPWCTVTTSPWRRPCAADAEHAQPDSRAGRSAAASPAWPPCARAGPACARRRRGRARPAGPRPPRRRPGRAPARCARAPRARPARSPAGRRPGPCPTTACR